MNVTSETRSGSPAFVNRWNWGAFFLTIVWAAFNKAPRIAIGLFVLVDVILLWLKVSIALSWPINFIMALVFGLKGNAWAWQSGKWNSIDEFNHAQGRWARYGVMYLVSPIVILLILAFIAGVYLGFGNFDELIEQPLQLLSTPPASSNTPPGWQKHITDIAGNGTPAEMEFDLPPDFHQDCQIACSVFVENSGNMIHQDIANVGYNEIHGNWSPVISFGNLSTNGWVDLNTIIPTSTEAQFTTNGGVIVDEFHNPQTGAWLLLWALSPEGQSIDPMTITRDDWQQTAQHSLMSYDAGHIVPLSVEAQIVRTISISG